MSKALEAAKDAFWRNWPIGSDETGERWSKHPDDVSEQEQNKCLQAAISAYLAHLVEDEAVVERGADAIIAAQAGPAKRLSDITSPYGRDYELRKAKAALRTLNPSPPSSPKEK